MQPLDLRDSWWTVAAAAVLVPLALTTCLWVSMHLHVDPVLHRAALFVHLACLVLGFGAVLMADYTGMLWLTRRCGFADAVEGITRLHLPVWVGLTGLTVSGVMLQPDLTSPLTRIKLVLVLLLALNGLQARLLTVRLRRHRGSRLSGWLLTWGAGTALISQICWWTVMTIGFLNREA